MKFYWYTIPLIIAWFGMVTIITTIVFSFAFGDPIVADKRSDMFVAVGFVTAVSGLVAILVGVVVQMIFALIRGEM